MAVPVPSRMSFFDATTGTFDQAGFNSALAAYQADRGMLTGMPTGTVQGGGAINPIAVTKENNPEGEFLIIPASTRGEAKNPFIAPPEPYYGTEADLREMYDNTNELKDTFGSFDNYLNYSQEVQSNLESADWFVKAEDSFRPSSTEWAVLNGEDIGLSPNQREQAWSNINDRRKNAVKSNYQQWLMQEDTQGLLSKYGIDPVKYDDKGNVYTFTGNNYQMTVKADQPSFADYATAILKIATSAALGQAFTVGLITPLAQSAGLTYGQTGQIVNSLLNAGGTASGASTALNDALDVLDASNAIVNLGQQVNDLVETDVPPELGQQQEEAQQETAPVVDFPLDIFIDTTQDEPIVADVETGDVTAGLPDIPIEEEEEGGGGAEATPIVTPTPEVTPEPTPTPVTPAPVVAPTTPVTPAPVVAPTAPVAPAPEQPQPTTVAPVVTPNVTPAPAPAPQESTSAAQEGTQGELGYERRRVTREDGSLWSVLIDTQTGNEVPESSFILRDANGNIVGDTSDPFEGFYQVDDKGDFVTDETGNRLVDWVLWENTFLPAGYNIQEAAGQEGTQQEEVPQATQTPVQTEEQTQEPSEDTSSVVGSLLDQYITPVRDQIQQQENAIGNLVNQVANMPVPPTQEEIIGYLRQNGVPLDEATLTNIQNRINEATANQITQEQVDEALINAGFVKPEDVKTAIEGAGFATPDDVKTAVENAGFATPDDIKNAVADAGFATPEDIDDALAGLDLNFATPDDVKNAIADAGFATPDDIDTAVSNAGFATPDDIDTALSNAGFTTPEDVTNALAESGFATTEQLESAIGGLDFAKPSDVVDAIAKSGFATPADIATALTESGFASAEELADLESVFESSLTGLESAFGTSLEGIRGEFETGLEGLGEGLAGLGEGLEGLGEGLEQGLSEAELGRRQLASRINQREFKPAPIPQLSYQPLQLEGLIQGPQRDYVNELNQIINRSLFEGII